jgi:hypothetical protein
MIKSLLAATAATALLSGVALAQSTTVIIPGAPPPNAHSDGSTTIKANIAPDGTIRAQATQKSLGPDGQPIVDKQSYQTGPEGTQQSHSQRQVDPDTGTAVTNSTTTITR